MVLTELQLKDTRRKHIKEGLIKFSAGYFQNYKFLMFITGKLQSTKYGQKFVVSIST